MRRDKRSKHFSRTDNSAEPSSDASRSSARRCTELRKIDPITTQRITDWQAIIGFRNVLIHGYGQVDDAKTWDIVQSEVPVLLAELDELLK